MGHTLEEAFYKREHANNQYVYKDLLGHHWPEKCKLKPRQDTIAHPPA